MMFSGKQTVSIIGILLSVMLLVGSIAVNAADDQTSGATEADNPSKLLARAAEILGVDQDALLQALNQACLEQATERIDKLVEEEWLGEKRAAILKQKLNELADKEVLFFVRYLMGPKEIGRHPGRLAFHRFQSRKDAAGH